MTNEIGNYSVHNYGLMIADTTRMDAYITALRTALERKPDALVLDIGAGTGIFAMLACRYGARHVVAIEPNNAILVARELAAANGYADQIEFIQKLSTDVTLPEKADILICDLRGVVPIFDHHIQTHKDARTRLLAADGILIPQRDTVWVAVISSPEKHHKAIQPWGDNHYDLNWQAAERVASNNWAYGRIEPEQIILAAQEWAVLDYRTIEDINFNHTVTWTVAEENVAHGLAMWFDAELMDGIGFSGAPGKPQLVYGSPYLPWPQAVTLMPGDEVSAAIRADFVSNDYIWMWDTVVRGSSGAVKASFRQSTFLGEPLTPDYLLKRADHYVPTLDDSGQQMRFVLQAMYEGQSLGEIANQLMAAFPKQFSDWRQALDYAAELSLKYSK